MPDVSETLKPKSDQLDNIDLRGGEPRIFTVTQVDVRPGAEQPVTVHLAEFDRPWKPGKNMRRVLAFCWSRESDNWVGKRVELYADEKVKFGNETPGGTRISRLSGIDGPKSAPIMLSQGRAGLYKVDPLPDAPQRPPEPTAEDVAACIDVEQLKGMWSAAGPERREQIKARVAELQAEVVPSETEPEQ